MGQHVGFMCFEELLGNEPAKAFLKRSLQTKNVPNALLFAGPEGVGKNLFAREFALELMYSKNPEKKARSHHADLHVYSPEGKMQMHSIASIRSLIDEVSMAPFEAEAKIFVIQEAERMLPTSSNALLKTLEEPTENSYLILLSSRPDEFLPTVISRCCRLNFTFISEEQIASLLVLKYKKDAKEAKRIAKQAQGSVGKALDMALHTSYDEIREALFGILAKRSISTYYELSKAILDLEKLCNEPLSAKAINEQEAVQRWKRHTDLLFSHILMWYRDLHLINSGCDRELLFFSDHFQEIDTKHCNNLPSLEKVHQALDEVRLGFDRNMRLSACLEQLFFKLDLI